MSDNITLNVSETVENVTINVTETVENVTINITEAAENVTINVTEGEPLVYKTFLGNLAATGSGFVCTVLENSIGAITGSVNAEGEIVLVSDGLFTTVQTVFPQNGFAGLFMDFGSYMHIICVGTWIDASTVKFTFYQYNRGQWQQTPYYGITDIPLHIEIRVYDEIKETVIYET